LKTLRLFELVLLSGLSKRSMVGNTPPIISVGSEGEARRELGSTLNINLMSLTTHRTLMVNSNALAVSLERLSTGLRINSGADDPSGIVASELLSAEAASLQAAISNGERADQVLNVVDAGLNEVSLLLIELEGLVQANANDAGLTQAEKEANQTQVDAILQAVDKIANQASFQGTKLLSGAYDYITSGIDTTQLDDARVHNATIANGSFIGVTLNVVQSAQTGRIFIETAAVGAPGVSGTTLGIEVVGNVGVQQFSFASGATRAQLISSFNAFSTVTTGRLGNARDGWLVDLMSGGAANILTGNLTTAQKIIDSAIGQAVKMRGRIGSFQKDIVGSSIRLNSVTLEAVLASRSQIRDTDIALETANLTRQQVLVSASISALAIANAQLANLLTLLKNMS
jgi:flagellin-like hook-associated protein FlgL